ncbi:hypothetical protein IC582_010125 [Cucumis melo]
MKKTIWNLQDRVVVVEGQLTSLKSDIDELKGMMSTILKHIGLQRKDDEGDRKGFEGLVDHTLESEEVDAKTEDVDAGGTPHWLRMPKEDDTSNGVKHIELKKKVEIGLEEPIDVVDDEIEPFLTQRPHIWPARRKRASVCLSTPFTTLPIWSTKSTTTTSQCEPIVYDPIHKILDVGLDRLTAWITDKRTNDEVRETFHGKKSKIFFRDLFMCRQWLADERFLVAKWPGYEECIKENRLFDWKEEYRLVDYVVGLKKDFQDPWAVWNLLPSLTSAEEMRNILLPIRGLVPNLLDSTRFFVRRGGSLTYKESWPVVIVDSIPLQRNNSDYGIFTIKYFEYIASGFDLDTLCQENMSYFRKELTFQLWTNTPMY